MASQLRLTGVDEFLAELARLAPDLAAEAASLQGSLAGETAAELRAAYPSLTGQLRASVTVEREGSASPARVFTRLSVTAPYIEYYEFGTARTEPHPTFGPIVRRGREAFLRAVIARVKRRGLLVGGEAH
jgi:hypothetical protein